MGDHPQARAQSDGRENIEINVGQGIARARTHTQAHEDDAQCHRSDQRAEHLRIDPLAGQRKEHAHGPEGDPRIEHEGIDDLAQRATPDLRATTARSTRSRAGDRLHDPSAREGARG